MILTEYEREELRRQRRREIRRRRRENQVFRNRILLAAVVVLLIAAISGCASCAISNKKAEEQEQPTSAEVSTEAQVSENETTAVQTPETDITAIYGIEDLYGEYEYPWNQMSQDWSVDDVEGFFYHEISEESKEAGGAFPVIAQVYTYIVCKNYGIDYEVVFAMIEQESHFVWDAVGDDGGSIGLMQIKEKWHSDRMERLGVNDLTNPYHNILVGVDFLAELQAQLDDNELQMVDTLAAYNYGMNGAKKHLWSQGIHWYSYNERIMKRAEELKQEKWEMWMNRGRSVENEQ